MWVVNVVIDHVMNPHVESRYVWMNEFAVSQTIIFQQLNNPYESISMGLTLTLANELQPNNSADKMKLCGLNG